MAFKLPPLPPASSWYPGHMASFTRDFPRLLQSTHIVLEARDARLPLTSINPNFEAMLSQWGSSDPNNLEGSRARIVIYNKADLVPSWGIKPFERALGRYFNHTTFFTTAKEGKSVADLHQHLAAIARRHKQNLQHLNVLVVGMPNVGKSTILNHLRVYGIKGASSVLKASRLPGTTRTTSNRMRLNDDPLIYSTDSPGVMLPFLGYGDHARERAVKISLILGMNESLFEYEQLAAYLLFRINSINPNDPPYPSLLSDATEKRPKFPPTDSVESFLAELASRMGYLRPGGIPDLQRAAKWFVEWWRVSAGKKEDLGGSVSWGWGLDCQWEDYWSSIDSGSLAVAPPQHMGEGEAVPVIQGEYLTEGRDAHSDQISTTKLAVGKPNDGGPALHDFEFEASTFLSQSDVTDSIDDLESKFDGVIRRYLNQTKELGIEVSKSQLKKRASDEVKQQVEQKKNAIYGQKKRSNSRRRGHSR
ncbi:Mitochondrial GTPase [Serendipita sp. 411]|nr:Mitochondrial GTPase [Serendipita sp. 411]